MKIRLPFAAAFAGWCLLSGYLGLNKNLHFTHDKLLHAVMLFLAAVVFYWVFDTTRKRCIQLTAAAVGGVFGVGSEFVQSVAVPSRLFDVFDILANLAGAATGIALCSWYHARLLERRRQARYDLLRGSNEEPSTTSTSQSTELENMNHEQV